VTGQSVNGWTVLEFSRPINASDSCDREVVDGPIIWATGPGVPAALEMHTYAGNTNTTDFVWFRTLPTLPTSVSNPGSTNLVSAGMSSTPPTQAVTVDTPVQQNSNPIPYSYGLPLYAVILIIVGVFLLLVGIVALLIGLVVRHRKRSKDTGNFY